MSGPIWDHLHALAADHKFIALGGAVPVNGRVDALMAWAVKAHHILREHGAVAHGFGFTRDPYPRDLPWYSVDSSYLDDPPTDRHPRLVGQAPSQDGPGARRDLTPSTSIRGSCGNGAGPVRRR